MYNFFSSSKGIILTGLFIGIGAFFAPIFRQSGKHGHLRCLLHP